MRPEYLTTVIIERFWAKVRKTDGCWLWTASIRNGYGQLGVGREVSGVKVIEYAHRLSWRLHVGDIPEGLCVLHHCDVRACVRPDHLFLGSKKDNASDWVAKGRAHRIGAKGERNSHARLTEAQVRTIRVSDGSTHQLATMHHVSISTIKRVRRCETWGHVI